MPETSRDRVLSDDEVRWFWKAADEQGYPFGAIYKLLLLTGQRRSEVAEMVVGEVDMGNRLWTIPKERAKNDQAHDVALSASAMVIIEALPRIVGKQGFLFTTTGRTPVSGWSRTKANFDKAMLAIARSRNGRSRSW